ncbi:unnamed protein product [Ostreobium quekettii]|uniref:Uncharacterized protein n=1 Tax=Ostreobium quekettii TaxID=121088 RepID=A0A8S1INQ3_9CHLO|nr:unnamed protein product [Ostreobium quekettii]
MLWLGVWGNFVSRRSGKKEEKKIAYTWCYDRDVYVTIHVIPAIHDPSEHTMATSGTAHVSPHNPHNLKITRSWRRILSLAIGGYSVSRSSGRFCPWNLGGIPSWVAGEILSQGAWEIMCQGAG